MVARADDLPTRRLATAHHVRLRRSTAFAQSLGSLAGRVGAQSSPLDRVCQMTAASLRATAAIITGQRARVVTRHSKTHSSACRRHTAAPVCASHQYARKQVAIVSAAPL